MNNLTYLTSEPRFLVLCLECGRPFRSHSGHSNQFCTECREERARDVQRQYKKHHQTQKTIAKAQAEQERRRPTSYNHAQLMPLNTRKFGIVVGQIITGSMGYVGIQRK